MTDSSRKTLRIGEILTVEIEKAAHGGHFIARYEGAVIFIRHAIPGEIVEVEITENEKSFFRGEIRAVIEASPHRVQAPCRYARPGGCGGCDFQHIDYRHQRDIKSAVIAEQFARIAKMEINIEVEEVSSPLNWRSRFSATINPAGELGFKETRSNKVVAISHCPILVPEIDFGTFARESIPADSRIEVALSTQGERTIAISPLRKNRREQNPPVEIIEGRNAMHYEVATSSQTLKYQVSQGSFWQSNINAPTTLIEAVKDFAQVKVGDHVIDLYGGVGLFAKALIKDVGDTGFIDLVEASTSATRDAQQNFRDYRNVRIHRGDVARLIAQFESADIVLLDPPRTGAGQAILTSITDMAPRAIVYIACDPAALARDTGYLRDLGFHLQSMRAFDLFPMTHHIESIALFTANVVS